MRKWKSAMAALAAAALFLAGCGGANTENTEVTSAETAEAAAEPEAEEGASEEKAGEASAAGEAEAAGAETAGGTDQVASAGEMTTVEDVVEDWMVPITADRLNEGTYPVTVASSSSMFKIASCELTVADGAMTAVLTMNSTSYLYLYMGTAEEAAAAPEEEFISAVETADGGTSFTVPVEALDKGIDVAAFSRKKEKWYSRTLVFRADSLPAEALGEGFMTTAADLGLADGSYTVAVTLEGGSGKASVASPAPLTVKDGQATAQILWGSANYDYMLVDGDKYLPVNTEGNSCFEIPVAGFDYPLSVVADTTAMSQPYEISYTLRFDSASILPEGETAPENEATPAEPEKKTAEGAVGTSGADSGSQAGGNAAETSGAGAGNGAGGTAAGPGTADWKDMKATGSMDLKWAKEFTVTYMGEGYALVDINETGRLLVVDEGCPVPAGLDEDIVVVQKPVDGIYLAATSGMDFFRALDALPCVDFVSLPAADWSFDDVADMVSEGKMTYVGKYSEPDYEVLAAGGSTLAIESTMIFHKPETADKLKALGIPVIVEHSSYEPDPMGRMEWIRFYGLLTGRDEEAEAFCLREETEMASLKEKEAAGKKVAFFYFTEAGVVVREPGDYVTRMIEMAGGKYAFDDKLIPPDGSSLSTRTIDLETFYAGASKADVLIYSGVSQDMGSIEEMISRQPLLADFKAVREGNVWATGRNMFQSSTEVSQMVSEFRAAIEGSDEKLTYMKHLA